MPRWYRSRSVDWGGLPSSPTSFCIFTIRDSAFSPELMVFLVYNHADKGKRGPLARLVEPDVTLYNAPNALDAARAGNKKKGKPTGYGMPGGGTNPEWLESQEGAAVREGGNESGIRVIRTRLIPIPGKKNKALILNKKTGEFIRYVLYADSQQESIELKPWEKISLNPMNYYLADVDWFNSKPREFLLGLKNELIVEGCTEEIVAQWGVSINTLTRKELLELGVDEEEVDEIGGFALLPVSLLRQMWKDKWFYLNPEEDRENRLDPTSYVYYSHVMRILEGLDTMGVA